MAKKPQVSKESAARNYRRKKQGFKYPNELSPIPSEDLESLQNNHGAKAPIGAWWSRKYLVQEFHIEERYLDREWKRLSINRIRRNARTWDDKLTWDELQQIKSDVGYGDWYAIEIFPPDSDVVNVANMRHLWLCNPPLEVSFGAFKYGES